MGTIGGLLRNHYNVERVQQAAYTSSFIDGPETIIDGLENFKSQLLAQEQQFYSLIGKTKQEFQAAYASAYGEFSTMSQRLYIIEQDFVNRYANSVAISDEQKKEIADKFVEKINQDIQGDPDIQRAMKKFGASVVDTIFATMPKNSNVTFTKATSRQTPLGTQLIGLGRLQLKISKDRTRLEYKKDADVTLITNEYIQKMEDYLNNTNSTKPSLDVNAFFTDLANALRSNGLFELVNLLPTARARMAINRSAASIKGFFGELYALGVLYHLYGQQATVLPTGSIRKSSSGQQIPIDVALQWGLQQFNFQVKNYQIKNNSITLSGVSSALNFIDNRLKMTGTVTDILKEFFASYQYNQPFTGSLAKYYEDSIMPVPEYDATVYQKFQSIFNSMQYNFDQFAQNVFKIQDVFSADSGGLFKNEQAYFNHFFIVQERVIPASDIIQQIIDGLKSNTPVTSYRLLTATNSADTLQGHYKDIGFQPPINALAGQVDIKYSITISV